LSRDLRRTGLHFAGSRSGRKTPDLNYAIKVEPVGVKINFIHG
jgi:hypothetical protein